MQTNLHKWFGKKLPAVEQSIIPGGGADAPPTKAPKTDKKEVAAKKEQQQQQPVLNVKPAKPSAPSFPSAAPPSSRKRPAEEEPVVDLPARKTRLQERLWGGETKEQEAMNEVQQRFRWLEQANVRDANGKRPEDAEYDPRTLRVPSNVFTKLSDSQKQYWEVKKKYRDVVIFFKVGKFYELYEDDAQIGHDLLGWKMTITGVGHCRQVGCPEAGIDEACAKLVAGGHKVGRMEQMETGAEAKARRGPKAFIRRELQQVSTPATATQRLEEDAVHLLALCETELPPRQGAPRESLFGFAFADAAAGRVYIGSLKDGASLAALSALLSQVSPKEVLVPRTGLSAATSQVLESRQSGVVTKLAPGLEFPDPGEAADAHLEATGLWGKAGSWPDAVNGADEASKAALAALAAHLKRLKAASELLAHCAVSPYSLYTGAMRLDGPTMANLELLEGAEGGRKGSLLERLDSCISPGGRRLLRVWLCRPLRSVGLIERRLDAVEELMGSDFACSFAEGLRSLCDLERALGRVRHVMAPPPPGLPLQMASQRQGRRLMALAAAAVGVTQAREVLATLGGAEATLLAQAAQAAPGNDSAAVAVAESVLELAGLSTSTTSSQLRKIKSLSVRPEALGNPEDAPVDEVPRAPQAQQQLGPNKAAKETDEEAKVRLEAEATSRLAAAFLEHIGVWEGMAEALARVDVLMAFAAFAAEADGATCRPSFLPPGSGADNGAMLDLKGLWNPCAVATQGGSGCIVPNDLSLGALKRRKDGARKSSGLEDESGSRMSCDSGGVGWVQGVKDARGTIHDGKPLPDGEKFGQARALLLTGPNMGGKSTMLRASCLATILAQVGCFVPASSCRMTLVDAVFSRLGASDRLLSGQSTFALECAETSAILSGATPDSMVVLDELGRGTSTLDGYAIAAAVLHHLAETVDCRMMFATHYHPLTSEFATHPRVVSAHMAAVVGGVSTASRRDSTATSMPSSSPAEANISFLYKMCPGGCPRSYGMQVAGLAGIPSSVIARAQQAGDRMEAVLAPAFDRASAGSGSTLPEALMRQILSSASSSHAALMGVWNGLVQSSSRGDEGTLLL